MTKPPRKPTAPPKAQDPKTSKVPPAPDSDAATVDDSTPPEVKPGTAVTADATVTTPCDQPPVDFNELAKGMGEFGPFPSFPEEPAGVIAGDPYRVIAALKRRWPKVMRDQEKRAKKRNKPDGPP